jgi:hypothetical protein
LGIVDGEAACIKEFEHEKKKKNSKSSCKIRLGPESNGHRLHEYIDFWHHGVQTRTSRYQAVLTPPQTSLDAILLVGIEN